MPAYFKKATGQRVTVDEATFDGIRLRDGYRAEIQQGESVRFSINMLDSERSRTSVFLTDNPKGDKLDHGRIVRDAARLADATGTAMMTPAIVAAAQARDAARQEYVDSIDHAGKAVRDALRSAHYN